MKGKVSSLVIAALKQIGKENVSQEVEIQLTKALKLFVTIISGLLVMLRKTLKLMVCVIL